MTNAEKWEMMKGDVRRTWSRLTDADLDQIQGDFTQLEAILVREYGLSPSQVHEKLEELTANFRRDIKQEFETTAPEDERTSVQTRLRDQHRQF